MYLLTFPFHGRIGRKAYWTRYLIPSHVLGLIAVLAAIGGGGGIVNALGIFMLVPVLFWLNVGLVKRLHDVNMSARWLLILLVPFIGQCLWVMLYVIMGWAESGESPGV
ncbi:MAG: DUF805 domain-containing protein [Chloroflexi bacterium]|nr:DUF805 domain-containing protein [Chloroflexota bacterium]